MSFNSYCFLNIITCRTWIGKRHKTSNLVESLWPIKHHELDTRAVLKMHKALPRCSSTSGEETNKRGKMYTVESKHHLEGWKIWLIRYFNTSSSPGICLHAGTTLNIYIILKKSFISSTFSPTEKRLSGPPILSSSERQHLLEDLQHK